MLFGCSTSVEKKNDEIAKVNDSSISNKVINDTDEVIDNTNADDDIKDEVVEDTKNDVSDTKNDLKQDTTKNENPVKNETKNNSSTNESKPVKGENSTKTEVKQDTPKKENVSKNDSKKEETKQDTVKPSQPQPPKEEVKKEEPHVHKTFFAAENDLKATGCLTYYDPTVYVDTLDESDEYAWRIADELGIASCRWTSCECSCGKIGTILFNVKYWEE